MPFGKVSVNKMDMTRFLELSKNKDFHRNIEFIQSRIRMEPRMVKHFKGLSHILKTTIPVFGDSLTPKEKRDLHAIVLHIKQETGNFDNDLICKTILDELNIVNKNTRKGYAKTLMKFCQDFDNKKDVPQNINSTNRSQIDQLWSNWTKISKFDPLANPMGPQNSPELHDFKQNLDTQYHLEDSNNCSQNHTILEPSIKNENTYQTLAVTELLPKSNQLQYEEKQFPLDYYLEYPLQNEPENNLINTQPSPEELVYGVPRKIETFRQDSISIPMVGPTSDSFLPVDYLLGDTDSDSSSDQYTTDDKLSTQNEVYIKIQDDHVILDNLTRDIEDQTTWKHQRFDTEMVMDLPEIPEIKENEVKTVSVQKHEGTESFSLSALPDLPDEVNGR